MFANTSELDARTNKSNALKNSIAISVLVAFFAAAENKNLFDWKHFNPNGFITLLFILFLFVCLGWWTKYFDNRPIISINEYAINIKKSIWPLSGYYRIQWNEVNFFYLLEKPGPRRTWSLYLVLEAKNIHDNLKIEITGLDKSAESIILLVKRYSMNYGFHDLGKESG